MELWFDWNLSLLLHGVIKKWMNFWWSVDNWRWQRHTIGFIDDIKCTWHYYSIAMYCNTLLQRVSSSINFQLSSSSSSFCGNFHVLAQLVMIMNLACKTDFDFDEISLKLIESSHHWNLVGKANQINQFQIELNANVSKWK